MSKNKKWNALLVILFGSLITCYGQKEQQPNFKIDGTINIDSGKVCLYFYSDYIPNEEKVMFAEVKDKKFSISGYIPEPQLSKPYPDTKEKSVYRKLCKTFQQISTIGSV